MSKRKADEMTKPEQNACLSTSTPNSSPRPSRPPFSFSDLAPAPNSTGVPSQDQGRPSPRSTTADKAGPHPSSRPDYLLVSCLILLYLELSWLILMILRPNSRH